MSDTRITTSEVLEMARYSRATLLKRIRQGKFPKSDTSH